MGATVGIKDGARVLELPAGVTGNETPAGVAPPGRMRFRYNDVAKQVEVSIDGGAYAAIGGGGGSPGGANTQVQYNDAGSFGGDPDFTFDGTNVTVANALFADGGVDRSAAAALAIGSTNATSVTVGALANPVTATVTIPDNTAAAWSLQDGNGDSYFEVTTTDTSELVDLGNTTTNPDVRILGSGNLEVARIDRAGFIHLGTALSTSLQIGRAGFNVVFNGQVSVQGFATVAQYLTLVERVGDPGFTPNQGKQYTKEVGGITELFYLDSAGTVTQITSNGTVPAGAGGANTQVQYNNAGVLAGDPDFTFDGTNVTLGSALFANGGVDRSAAAALALAPVNATSVTVGALANPITATVTIPDNTASAWVIRDAAGLGYMNITTTNAGEFVGFGNTTTSPDYFFNGGSIRLGVGSDASGTVEAAAFGPGALYGFSRAMSVGAEAQATSITMGHAAAPLTIDSSGVTVAQAQVAIGIDTNTASAFTVTDPSTAADYINITTTTIAPTISIGGSELPAVSIGETGSTIGVLGAGPQPRTAAYTVTNPVDNRSFDTATVAVDALAEVVGTMIADLQGFGFFG